MGRKGRSIEQLGGQRSETVRNPYAESTYDEVDNNEDEISLAVDPHESEEVAKGDDAETYGDTTTASSADLPYTSAQLEQIAAVLTHDLKEQAHPTTLAYLRSEVRPHPDAVTWATSCSIALLPRVEALARSWPGHIALALFIPAPEDSLEANTQLDYLQRWHRAMRVKAPAASMDVSLMFSPLLDVTQMISVTPVIRRRMAELRASMTGVPSPYDQMGVALRNLTVSVEDDITSMDVLSRMAAGYRCMFPINALRNLARRTVDTALLVQADVDFVPDTQLHAALSDPVGTPIEEVMGRMREGAASLGAPPVVLLPPTVQIAPGRQRKWLNPLTWGALPSTLEELETQLGDEHPEIVPHGTEGRRSLLDPGRLGEDLHEAPHPVSSISLWNRTKDRDSRKLFNAKLEATFVAYTNKTRAFDERYLGYGHDAADQLLMMSACGTEFWTLPEHFLIHLPHEPSLAQEATKSGAFMGGHISNKLYWSKRRRLVMAEAEVACEPGFDMTS